MTHRSFTWHFLYWFFPLLCVTSVFLAWPLGPQALQLWVVSPHGFLENIPSVFLLIAIGYCFALLRQPMIWQDKNLRWWLIAFIIAAVYFGGEDENWGEYWFNWRVPNYFLEHNKEHETNLHNMSTWFNQKPRIAMELWALTACLAFPLGWRWPQKITRGFVPACLWPATKDFIPVVLLALVIDIAEKLDKHVLSFDLMATGIRLSEIQEMVLAYLMLLYACDLWQRLRIPGSTGHRAILPSTTSDHAF